MKVKELIEQLRKAPDDVDVVFNFQNQNSNMVFGIGTVMTVDRQPLDQSASVTVVEISNAVMPQ